MEMKRTVAEVVDRLRAMERVGAGGCVRWLQCNGSSNALDPSAPGGHAPRSVGSACNQVGSTSSTVLPALCPNRGCLQDERDEPFTGNFARLLAPFGIHTGRQLVRAAARIAQAVQGCAILITLARVALYPENRSWVAVVYLAFMGAAIRFSRWAMWTTTQ